jgi:hypothetical protein
MVILAKDKLMRLAKRHKIQVVDLYIKIQPIIPGVSTENIAFMEFSMSGKFI